jgi:hypothetical protein
MRAERFAVADEITATAGASRAPSCQPLVNSTLN